MVETGSKAILERRHLSAGQKSAIALDWSEQIELSPHPEKIVGPGRQKGSLSKAARPPQFRTNFVCAISLAL
jgi:hypothetical protein